MTNESLRSGTLFFITLILALSLHEFAHALAALLLGDTTAKDRGRLSLNPMNHLDPLGTMMLLFLAFQNIGIGWAKPVPVDPTRFKNSHRGMGIVSIAGPLSNLLQAIVGFNLYVGVVQFIIPAMQEPSAFLILISDFLQIYVQVNLSLAAFNLLPIYPLDGAKVLSALLPPRLSRNFDLLFLRLGMWPLVGVVLWEWILPFPGPISLIMGPFLEFLLKMTSYSAFWL